MSDRRCRFLLRRRSRPLLRVLLLALGLAWGSAPAGAADARYEALAESKALAVAPRQPERVGGLSHSQPHDLAAALQALQQCEAGTPAGEACELVRLNDEHITTGREILERVPEAPHPLFLWHFRQGATELWLAGSIHILKPSLYPLPRQLEAAFRQADYLVLEVNVDALDAAALQRRTLSHARLPEGQTLRDVLPAPLYGRLERRLASYGLTADMVSAAKPALVMTQLVLSRLMTLGYLPDAGLESHFLGQRTHQQILELETLDEQLELLFGQPMAVQVQLLAETLDMADDIEPLLADLLVAWLSGDDAAFLELFKAQSGDSDLSRAFNRALLDERNTRMAAGIIDLLSRTEPATYFVLVGAAHLVGEAGIVEELRRRGVEGTRIASDHEI